MLELCNFQAIIYRLSYAKAAAFTNTACNKVYILKLRGPILNLLI